MYCRFLLGAITVCLAIVSPLTTAQAPPAATELLKVFLQGGSATELQSLVEAQGGTVTHDLHIIDAVGAELTRGQLEKVLESPLVTRFFDDLSISGQPPHDDPHDGDKNCDIGGSLELGINDSGINWRLYNKNPTAAPLQQLKLGWPAQFGALKKISLGDKDLDPALYANAIGGTATIEFTDTPDHAAPALTGIGDLSIGFQREGDPAAAPAGFYFGGEILRGLLNRTHTRL